MKTGKSETYKCLGLLARNHGLETLKHLLLYEKNFEVIGVFTHKLNPKSYDPERKIRTDFHNFFEITSKYNIPLFTIDSKTEKSQLDDYTLRNDYDFLISISWRYLIPPMVFRKAKIGAINLHRGDLPKYAGIEPIKKALENKERKITICSHHISENIDEGKVICKATHPTNYESNKTLEENVERLKNEITPYFPKLTMKSLEIISSEQKHES